MKIQHSLRRLGRIRRALFSAICMVPLVAGGNLRAQEVVPLTVIDAYAPTALWVRVFMNYYMPEVDRRLAESGNYEIDWNRAFGGTVAKTGGVLEALQYGLADIGIKKTGETYGFICDWENLETHAGIDQKTFMKKVLKQWKQMS